MMKKTVISTPTAIALPILPSRCFRWMMIIIAGLMLTSALGQWGYAQWPDFPGMGLAARITDVDAERSFPTAYSSLALLVCAIVQGGIAYSSCLSPRSTTKRWWALSAIFLYLSADELLGFHELANEPLEALNLGGIFYFAWVLPGIALVGLFLISFFKFWLHLPSVPRALFFRAALLFVGGALGIEMINGAYASQWGETWVYIGLQHLEEFLEMWGVATLLQGLLFYISLRLDNDRFIPDLSQLSNKKSDQLMGRSQ